MTDAVLLVAHGTVDELDDLPEFLKNIRRGHAPSPELLAEVRRRYEAIGGRSPLNSINRALAAKLSAHLGQEVGFANRLFRPYPKEVLQALVQGGATRIVVVPLAQHSAQIYGESARQAAAEAGLSVEILAAPNWGRIPELTEAFAQAIAGTARQIPEADRSRTRLLMTAHSLPVSVAQAGDPYEAEVRGSAEDVAARLQVLAPGAVRDHAVAFQSQGMSTGPGGRPIAWLGPDLKSALAEAAAAGRTQVVIAPIGFLADHVEILYDLDIEARTWADELGIVLRRVPSLDTSDALVGALAKVVRDVARGGG